MAVMGGHVEGDARMAMKKLLVFQHVAYEILGTLNPLLKDAGFRIRYVNFGRDPGAQPRLEGYHGLVVLGGPMGVDDVAEHPHLETEVRVIREAIDQGIPVLGVCLGAQLIAKALGARAIPNGEKEIGWYDVMPTPAASDDPLLGNLLYTEKIFQWHRDTFDLPDGAVHLASSSAYPNQAFRFGDNVYGFQFHLEVDEPMIKRWLNIPVHVAEIESTCGQIDSGLILKETPVYIDTLKDLSRRIFGEFINLMGVPRKRRRLPSR